MKFAHTVELSVFSYEREDANRISAAIAGLCPFDLAQEKVVLSRSTAQGFNERKIIIFEIMLSKERHTSKFMSSLKEHLSDDQRTLIVKQADSRLDSELNFFIRLDKDKLLGENKYWVTDSGNCFHIKISVAAFPADKTAGLKVIENWLG